MCPTWLGSWLLSLLTRLRPTAGSLSSWPVLSTGCGPLMTGCGQAFTPTRWGWSMTTRRRSGSAARAQARSLGRSSDAVHAGGGAADIETAALSELQAVHWTIHRAFSEYQRVGEDRRHLAAEIGELIAQMVAELVAAGWTEEQARTADVRALAAAAAR